MHNPRESVLARLLRKQWSANQIEKYIGNTISCYFTYAKDEKLRKRAASGGSISALFAYLLSEKLVDGVLVCRGVITPQGTYRAEFFIARSVDDLIQAQGSKYVAVYFAHEALPLMQAFNGKLAVAALPCDMGILTRLCDKDEALREKIVLKIALFCGHNSEPVLTDTVIDRIRPGDRLLTAFRHRVGHWRGSIQADFAEGHRISRPFSFFSDYQNLYFFCQRKCHHCHDHTGYYADISAGDIWSLRMKQESVKHTALLTRTSRGEELLNSAIAAGWLVARVEPVEEVCEGQARTMPFHYNITARSRMGWLIGERIRDDVHERVHIGEYLTAAMALGNEKISRSSFGRKVIFWLPKPLLKLYLYLFKALESIS